MDFVDFKRQLMKAKIRMTQSYAVACINALTKISGTSILDCPHSNTLDFEKHTLKMTGIWSWRGWRACLL